MDDLNTLHRPARVHSVPFADHTHNIELFI